MQIRLLWTMDLFDRLSQLEFCTAACDTQRCCEAAPNSGRPSHSNQAPSIDKSPRAVLTFKQELAMRRVRTLYEAGALTDDDVKLEVERIRSGTGESGGTGWAEQEDAAREPRRNRSPSPARFSTSSSPTRVQAEHRTPGAASPRGHHEAQAAHHHGPHAHRQIARPLGL